MSEEIKFTKAIPNLPVDNAKESIHYYCEVLGFSLDWDDDVVGYDETMYASVSRGDFQVCLDQHRADKQRVEIWCYVSDVYKLYQEYKTKSVKITQEPQKMPWGEIELGIEDNNGNKIGFTQKSEQ